jgi:hypothetical protein
MNITVPWFATHPYPEKGVYEKYKPGFKAVRHAVNDYTWQYIRQKTFFLYVYYIKYFIQLKNIIRA